jgi:hypothetical protein
MSSLDGIANARTSISDSEAATRERIYDGSKLCKVCGEPYEFSLRVVYGQDSDTCVHDAVTKGPNADRSEIARMAERAIKAETHPFP